MKNLVGVFVAGAAAMFVVLALLATVQTSGKNAIGDDCESFGHFRTPDERSFTCEMVRGAK